MKRKLILPLCILGMLLWCSSSALGVNIKALPKEERIAPTSSAILGEKAYCRLQNDDGTPYWSIYGHSPGNEYANYFDPALCGSPAYPFGLDTVEFVLGNNTTTWPLVVNVNIYEPAGDSCGGPGSLLCTEPFTIEESEVYPNVVKRALSLVCCLYGPFFLSLELVGPGDFNPMTEQNFTTLGDTCRAWVEWGVWYNWSIWGSPPGVGYPCIRAIGQTVHPNCLPDTLRNHFKTWRIEPKPFFAKVLVQDQFMSDSLVLDTIELFSNPVKKVDWQGNDTSEIVDSLEHLIWYRAYGRDTLLEVEYLNQFGTDTVHIDSVKYLLLPTAKEYYPFPESLDHYKAYRIRNPMTFDRMLVLEDQFDRRYGSPEYIDSLKPVYFLTPALKNMPGWPMFDSITHYVAYEIFPKRFFPLPVNTFDQFGQHLLQVDTSKFLLVPTYKLSVTTPVTCGDVNNDGIINVGDIIYLINYLFRSGPPPVPFTCIGDVNNNDVVEVGDIVYLLNYLFLGGVEPNPNCCTPPWLK